MGSGGSLDGGSHGRVKVALQRGEGCDQSVHVVDTDAHLRVVCVCVCGGV